MRDAHQLTCLMPAARAAPGTDKLSNGNFTTLQSFTDTLWATDRSKTAGLSPDPDYADASTHG